MTSKVTQLLYLILILIFVVIGVLAVSEKIMVSSSPEHSLSTATEEVWGVLNKTSRQNEELTHALNSVPIITSGVRTINGENHLYFGIDEEEYDAHDIEGLRKVLENTFPGIPIYIKPEVPFGPLEQQGVDTPDIQSSLPEMGGDYSASAGGTITLGGLETSDDVRGFVGSGHVYTGIQHKEHFSNVEIVKEPAFAVEDGTILGRLFALPSVEGNQVGADAVFFSYPYLEVSGCLTRWECGPDENVCADFYQENGEQIERVAPLQIRGVGNEVYTVVGSKSPYDEYDQPQDLWISVGRGRLFSEGKRDVVFLSEYVTGNARDPNGNLVGDLASYTGNEVKVRGFSAKVGSGITIPGDSGSPVYTVPDENGNVYIVGVHSRAKTWLDDVTIASFQYAVVDRSVTCDVVLEEEWQTREEGEWIIVPKEDLTIVTGFWAELEGESGGGKVCLKATNDKGDTVYRDLVELSMNTTPSLFSRHNEVGELAIAVRVHLNTDDGIEKYYIDARAGKVSSEAFFVPWSDVAEALNLREVSVRE